MGVKVYPREQPFMTCLPPFSIQLCGWVLRPIYWILGIDNDNRTCEKKKEKKKGENSAGGPSTRPGATLSLTRPHSLGREREKGERRERPRHKPGGVPPEGDEPTGHKDESQ